MNAVGLAHIVSCLILSVVVGIIYSINIQGWRQTEPLMRGIIRRTLKIILLLVYLGIMVAALSAADEKTGGGRLLFGGIGGLMAFLILVGMLFPGFVPDFSGAKDSSDQKEPEPKSAS